MDRDGNYLISRFKIKHSPTILVAWQLVLREIKKKKKKVNRDETNRHKKQLSFGNHNRLFRSPFVAGKSQFTSYPTLEHVEIEVSYIS